MHTLATNGKGKRKAVCDSNSNIETDIIYIVLPTRRCITQIIITYSRVEIRLNPKKIARKGFLTVSGTVSGGEYHTKNLPKSEYRKAVKSKMASNMAANRPTVDEPERWS